MVAPALAPMLSPSPPWCFRPFTPGSLPGILRGHEPLPTDPLDHTVSILGGFSVHTQPPDSLSPQLPTRPSLPQATQLQGSPPWEPPVPAVAYQRCTPSSAPKLFHSPCPQPSCQLRPRCMAVTSPEPLSRHLSTELGRTKSQAADEPTSNRRWTRPDSPTRGTWASPPSPLSSSSTRFLFSVQC